MRTLLRIFKESPNDFENYLLINRDLIRKSITDEHNTLGLSWIFDQYTVNMIKNTCSQV